MNPGGLLARVVRGGLVESVHLGHLVVLGPDGEEVLRVGDPDATIWPRSSLKPLQAVAMLRSGLGADARGLALACASHSGTAAHLDVVRGVLAGAGLTEDDLQNTPDLPLDPDAAFAWRAAGRGAAALTQNCSGKHAAMLATCVAADWDTASYLAPDHPLQRAVRTTVEAMTDVGVEAVTVDGCGSPLLSTTVTGLARAFGAIAHAGCGSGEAGDGDLARVAAAMTTYPDLVGGPGRDVSAFMAAVPGLVAKDGAEGVYSAGLPDGSAVAFKVADGSARPRAAVLAWALALLLGPEESTRTAIAEVGRSLVLGHGEPVGQVLAGPADEGLAAG